MTTEFSKYVKSKLNQLETRDLDQLFDCLMDNLAEKGDVLSDVRQCSLYQTIEFELRKQSLSFFKNNRSFLKNNR